MDPQGVHAAYARRCESSSCLLFPVVLRAYVSPQGEDHIGLWEGACVHACAGVYVCVHECTCVHEYMCVHVCVCLKL